MTIAFSSVHYSVSENTGSVVLQVSDIGSDVRTEDLRVFHVEDTASGV